MSKLRTLPLVDASVPADAEFREAVARLFDARVAAIAVLDDQQRLVGVFSERDVLRAIFPAYLAELRHTTFLADDPAALAELAATVSREPASKFAREVDPLDADESEMHAAERFLHMDEKALPVVEGERFLGMLSMAALCHAQLDRVTGE